MADDPDAALVLESRAGNRRAFEQLVARHARAVFNAAYRILHHREDATDVTQIAFLRAYERLDRYDPAQRFAGWLYRIAVNESLDMARTRGRDEPMLDEPETEADGPDESLAHGQLDAGLQRALMAIKVEYRTLIVLKHVQGRGYDEIAAILDCPVKTVKSRLFTARQALREALVARGLLPGVAA